MCCLSVINKQLKIVKGTVDFHKPPPFLVGAFFIPIILSFMVYTQLNPSLRIGKFRGRSPAAANALHNAGATVGKPTSPTPPGSSVLSII
jgi:hypothetical protein